ncbi:DUF6497 family protein [Phaeobacter sp. HF9A]|uniref:DUF6497 family protein n=1 Tax=Phaeobacter sp. HF9A TaxID=2721561 RepID=UPI0020CA6885|nr:DUF6497 family protein [Phaeobacter sp. HF9A]
MTKSPLQSWVDRRGVVARLVSAIGLSGLCACLLSGAAAAASEQANSQINAQPPSPDAPMIPVPSGQPVTLSEVLLDEAPGALWARFRFVAPQIAGQTEQGDSAEDIDYLCARLALPYVAHHQISPARVVISLADRAVPFGTSAPEATQFFETYRIADDTCVWEGF